MSIQEPDLNQDVILYHGSRGGMCGEIRPCSRERCDFGKGFYLGDNPDQTRGIAAPDQNPYWYEVKLRLSEVPDDKKIYVSGMEWLYVIMAYRDKVPDFSKLNAIQEVNYSETSYRASCFNHYCLGDTIRYH